MTENCRRFGTPGIEAIIGDFLSVDLSALEAPDAIFIGGHGGELVEILMVVSKKMKESGVIVFNSVSDESKALLEEAVAKPVFGYPPKPVSRLMILIRLP